MSRTATVACLTGAGTAPELMAEAVFALDRVARLHNVNLRETHASFGGVAFARAGQMVPPSTRATVLGADAVLVAGAEEPTLDEVMGDRRGGVEIDGPVVGERRRHRGEHPPEGRR